MYAIRSYYAGKLTEGCRFEFGDDGIDRFHIIGIFEARITSYNVCYTKLLRIIARYGFMEEPNIENILALIEDKGVAVTMKGTSFFLGREKIAISDRPSMNRWRCNLFDFLSRNAMDASAYFGIPSDQVIEVGVQLEL